MAIGVRSALSCFARFGASPHTNPHTKKVEIAKNLKITSSILLRLSWFQEKSRNYETHFWGWKNFPLRFPYVFGVFVSPWLRRLFFFVFLQLVRAKMTKIWNGDFERFLCQTRRVYVRIKCLYAICVCKMQVFDTFCLLVTASNG